MKICIAGGGGGASNAANVIRQFDREAEITIFTNRDHIGNLPCEIPHVLRGTLSQWEDSFAFRDKFYQERRVHIHFNSEVSDILPDEHYVIAAGKRHYYDKLILNLGAVPRVSDVKGLDGRNEFVLATDLKYARVFHEAIPRHTSAAVIGVGQISLEVADMLEERGYTKIYLIGRSDRVLRAYLDHDMSVILEKRIREKNVELLLNRSIVNIFSRRGKKIVVLDDEELEVDLVFFGIGARPNTDLAVKAGIALGRTGAIAVNEFLQTSQPDIYAIGDCMENWETITGGKILYQTATSAARTGRIAGKNVVLGNTIRFPGTVMPFIAEISGRQVGTVGFTEEKSAQVGLDTVSHITMSAMRRRVFGGRPVQIKLIADRETHTLVGAQLIGEELVAGKIDRLALAIMEKVPVERLSLVDTCYSPTTGAGYEAVAMALDRLLERLL